ncbi:MAG: hypothetical protein ABH873_01285 [Candidatus Firestonebacteria bacterium]
MTLEPKNTIYRGMFIKKDIHKYKVGSTVLFFPKRQFSSWTTEKNNVDYFQRGSGWGLTLKTKVPKNIFYVQGFFNIVNKLDSLLYDLENYRGLDKEEIKVLDLLDLQLYSEGEVWVFGKVKAVVIKLG